MDAKADAKGVSRSELLAILGGVLLLAGLFLGWYDATGFDSINGKHGTFTGWEVHTLMRWLLLAAALAPLILAYILIRGHALSWPRGELTAVVAIAAFGLIAYNAFVAKPGTVSGQTSLKLGVFVSLLGTLLMLAGSAARASQVERKRKPPGTI